MKTIIIFYFLSLCVFINVDAQTFSVDGEKIKVEEVFSYGFGKNQNWEMVYGKDTIPIIYLSFDHNPFIVEKIHFGKSHYEIFVYGTGKEFSLTQKNGQEFYGLSDIKMTLHFIKVGGKWKLEK